MDDKPIGETSAMARARRSGPAGALARRCGAGALRALLPGACALCGGAGDEMVCADCARQFFGPGVAPARCRCCANPLPGAAAGGRGAPGPVEVARQPPAEVTGRSPAAVAGRPPADVAGRSPAAAIGPSAVTADVAGPPARGRDADLLCGQCASHRPSFDLTLTAADYTMPVDQLVLQLKFGHRLALAALFARLLRDAVLQQPGFGLPALICPVPLGPRRLAERGYNQALEIARPLARSLGVALHPRLLARVRETAAQSSVAPEHRQRNVAGAFAIADAALVRGRHVGIVDDVMTSGRTLDELAATLKRHGAARVSNLVFARTPPH